MSSDLVPAGEFRLPPNPQFLTLVIKTVWGPQLVIVPYPGRGR